MPFTLDEPSDVRTRRCDDCGTDYTLVKSFVLDQRGPYAVAFTACHQHEQRREAWLDVILGSFGNDDPTDHVTFGCRVGPVGDPPEPAATAVPAAVPYGDSPVWGRKLSREEALAHPRLADFWAVVDFILLTEPVVEAHVYRQSPG